MANGKPTVKNDDAIIAVDKQGWAQGSAYFGRNEGATYDNGTIYFCSTQGGGDPESPDVSTPRTAGYGKGFGQVWAFHTWSQELELVYQSPGRQVLDFPDNVTVSKTRLDRVVRGQHRLQLLAAAFEGRRAPRLRPQ